MYIENNYFLTYILTTRFGPFPNFTPVITKCTGVASSHNSVLETLELFFTNVKSALTAASTCTLVDILEFEKIH